MHQCTSDSSQVHALHTTIFSKTCQLASHLQPFAMLDKLERIFVEVMDHIIVFLTDHVNVALQATSTF